MGVKVRLAAWGAMPFLLALAAGGKLWVWLWGRWFSPGAEFFHGCIHLVLLAGCLVYLMRNGGPARKAHLPSLSVAAFFMLAAAFFYGRVPTLAVAGLYSSAVYWSFRSSLPRGQGKTVFAICPLLLLSLPVAPSLQFVFGYPLRAMAAKAAALVLPGAVKAVGCGLGDGTIEVFVDAPCAGAGMLISALFLAAGTSLVCRFKWLRTGVMLALGVVCALIANAVRAAILYLGNAGRISFPLHEYENATGLFCFTASALVLAAAAIFLSKSSPQTDVAPEHSDSATGVMSVPVLRFYCGTSRFCGFTAVVAAYVVSCVLLFFALLQTNVHGSAHVAPSEEITWPKTWGGNAIVPCELSPETEKLLSGFPGAYREFSVVSSGAGEAPQRIVMRLTTQPTRLLHPAQDCFRGSGFSITPLPASRDIDNRLWSGFIAEKNGRKRVVRQCVIALKSFDLGGVEKDTAARSWPDVSSWYWDAARPGTGISPLALAVTIISEPSDKAPMDGGNNH